MIRAPLHLLSDCRAQNGSLIPAATPPNLPITVCDFIFYQNRLGNALESYSTPEEAKDGILIGFGDREFNIIESEKHKTL